MMDVSSCYVEKYSQDLEIIFKNKRRVYEVYLKHKTKFNET